MRKQYGIEFCAIGGHIVANFTMSGCTDMAKIY